MVNKDEILKAFGIRLPHWAIMVLWTIGILTMSSLTVKDLCPIVQEYYDVEENAEVQIKVRRADEEFRPPDLYFCIPMANYYDYGRFVSDLSLHIDDGRQCPLCEVMANHSYDVWNRIEPIWTKAMLRRMEHDSEERKLQDKFAAAIVENASEVTRAASLSWTRPILIALVDYLSRKTRNEKNMLDKLMHNNSVEEETPPATKHVLDALYSALVSFVCEFVSISGDDDEYVADEDKNKNFCQETYAESSLPDKRSCNFSPCTVLCTRIPLTRADELHITVRPEYFADYVGESDDEEKARFQVFTDTPGYPTKKADASVAQLYKSQLDDPGEMRSEEVTLVYSLQSSVIEKRVHKQKSCYDQSSKAQCELTCWVSRLESICGCRMYASGWRSLVQMPIDEINDTTSITCDSEDVLRCRERVQTSHPYDCAGQCLIACQSHKYEWQVSSSLMDTGNRSKELKLRIEKRRRSYLEFTTKVKDSSEDFISQIGGVFNFYLGLSGLSIICFAIRLLESARAYVAVRREQRDNVGGDGPAEPISAWRRRWSELLAAAATKDTVTRGVNANKVLSQKFEASERATDEALREIDERMEQRITKAEKHMEALMENTADMGETLCDIRDTLDRKKVPKRRKVEGRKLGGPSSMT